MQPLIAIYLIWFAWFVSWFAAAAWSNPTIKRAGWARELFFRSLLIAGYILLFGFIANPYDVRYHLWDTQKDLIGCALVALTVAGLAFAWWARLHLGRLWSSSITRKNEHKIIDSGPYRLVRHPIYTGIIFAVFATALLQGKPSAFLGAALLTLGWFIKARIEERFLREELGPEAYDSYARRVPMLVPFRRRRG
jgi:protein-S-isoprenylcysteine O-methyltransferase Ste14